MIAMFVAIYDGCRLNAFVATIIVYKPRRSINARNARMSAVVELFHHITLICYSTILKFNSQGNAHQQYIFLALISLV